MSYPFCALRSAILCIALTCAPFFSFALDFTGAELSYIWTSGNTYAFTLKLYSSCSDPELLLPPTASLCYRNNCDGTTGTVPLSLFSMPGGQPAAPQFKEYYYTGAFSLPAGCADWKFFATAPGRNTTVNQATGSYNLYVEATLNNTAGINNSSPQFPLAPAAAVAIGSPAFLPVAHFDPDGDSSVAVFIAPRTATASMFTVCGDTAGTDVAFAGSLSLTEPFQIASLIFPFTLNPNTGTMTFSLVSGAAGFNGYAVRIDNYRNGVFMGSSIRDGQFKAVPAGPTFQPDKGMVAGSFYGGQYSVVSGIDAYANTPFGFCFEAMTDPADNLHHVSLVMNTGNIFPGSTTVDFQGPDSVASCFSYTPAISDIGTHTFTILVRDSVIVPEVCDAPGVPMITMEYVVMQIRVHEPNSISGPSLPAIKWYPNPAKDIIRFDTNELLNISLLSADGKLVAEYSAVQQIDIRQLSPGLYFMQVKDKTGNSYRMEKLMVE